MSFAKPIWANLDCEAMVLGKNNPHEAATGCEMDYQSHHATLSIRDVVEEAARAATVHSESCSFWPRG